MGVVEWSALAAAITFAITVGGVLVRLVDRLNKSETKAAAADKSACTALARIITVEKQLVDLRVSVAKEYVSHPTLATLENRIVEAINRLGDRLDKIISRDAH